ncbi:glucose-6-phosphate dehydrogenase [Asaia krungthepensis]|uniref:Glucose-6-phosphate 1-dehydrogenase n=1 Tax=Asaia krungthepensis NRIC 0535 TaxID=1307925 RepID=A0ABQ0Q282_9PROT|nr:glucose-6-phosphate dehydrogenase [Asaia krungthepensis]GBQ87874.1 glucose-6-phosphate 1-dehydrogenase [Asaia krungthepensis NRIC 0535]
MSITTDQLQNVIGQASGSQPCKLVIFGAGGDLTRRLLLPSLYDLAVADALPTDFQILAVDRPEQTGAEWASRLFGLAEQDAKDPSAEFSCPNLDRSVWDKVTAGAAYLSGDFTQNEIFDRLGEAIGTGNVIFYMAVASRFFSRIASGLGRAGLLREDGYFRRIVVEKPFGHDLASARVLDSELRAQAQESQIYRIDHFLGKEANQGIMIARFSNVLFEPIWRREYIDHVQITASETIGVEKRGAFYERTGALRDMVPNHLFVLLSLIAMEPPSSLAAEAVRQEKTRLLQAVRPILPEDYVSGQYAEGVLNNADVPGYRNEPGVAPDSQTETYAAMRLFIDNWRWGGVPFYLRTGKRLSGRRTEINIVFKKPPYALFNQDMNDPRIGNVIRFLLDPVRGVSIDFDAKQPGLEEVVSPVRSTFLYDDFFRKEPNVGYEALLHDCMAGNQMLFQSAETIEASWAAIDGIVNPDRAPFLYPAGSQGPEEADTLLARDGRRWLSVT